ncbi:MAG: phosphatase PAP2 family protein [Turneriella sp.]
MVTGVITQVAKFSVARGRPFAYYGNDYSSPDGRLFSFFSGHTSYSFALALSSAMLLSPANHILSTAPAFMLPPCSLQRCRAICAFAADKHYLTDVLTGAIVGSAIAYGITRMQLNTNSVQYGDERRLQLQKVFVLP